MGLLSALPSPHPALDLHKHVHPALHKFLTQGHGLGVELIKYTPTSANIKALNGDKIYDAVASFFGYSTITQFQTHFVNWYGTHEPLAIALGACFWISLGCYVAERITGNMSQVDRIWAFLPWMYSAHFTFYPHFAKHGLSYKIFSVASRSTTATNWIEYFLPDQVDPRMFLIFLLQTLWSARINFNTLRRGIWKPWEEDYRWPLLRKDMPKWQQQFFALTFVAFMQNILLFATALPQYVLLTARANEHPTHAPPPLGWPDAVLAGAFLSILFIEQVADSQQQQYQKWKRSAKAVSTAGKSEKQLAQARGKLQRGFRTDGLWAWSRHPNFACEQLHWYILYLFTIRATLSSQVPRILFSAIQTTLSQVVSGKSANFGKLLDLFKEAGPHFVNYSLIGPIAMQLLFEGSGPYTEQISAAKYPLYKEYQKRVAMYWPVMTTVKAIGLGITGRLTAVNHKVFGAGTQATSQKKNK